MMLPAAADAAAAATAAAAAAIGLLVSLVFLLPYTTSTVQTSGGNLAIEIVGSNTHLACVSC